MKKYLIGTYTHHCKDYCDREFISRFAALSSGQGAIIIDNSPADSGYTDKLRELAAPFPWITVDRVNVDREPRETLFHRNVERSVSILRDRFLTSDADYLLIIESDVIPPVKLIELFDSTIDQIERTPEGNNWGIIGGLYYTGFHDFYKTGIQRTRHVLSGCSVYNRTLITQFPFRYDPENLAPFPDAWMSDDANKSGFTLWNNHDIICDHIEYATPGRKSRPL